MPEHVLRAFADHGEITQTLETSIPTQRATIASPHDQSMGIARAQQRADAALPPATAGWGQEVGSCRPRC
jgi:hypothetical protein